LPAPYLTSNGTRVIGIRQADIPSRFGFTLEFPLAENFARKLCRVVIDQLGAVLTEPDAVRDVGTLLRGHAGIETRTTLCSCCDVRSDTDIDSLGSIILWP
jgi:hypothetical protein